MEHARDAQAEAAGAGVDALRQRLKTAHTHDAWAALVAEATARAAQPELPDVVATAYRIIAERAQAELAQLVVAPGEQPRADRPPCRRRLTDSPAGGLDGTSIHGQPYV